MKYGKEFFDTYVERRNTRSIKWDGCNEKFGVDPSVEMLPMWIADMDFCAPEEVVKAVVERAEHGVYGYIINRPDSFPQSIQNWIRKRYHWEAEKEWVLFTPGVIPGFNIAYQTFTQPGDGIIVQTPIYYPFMDGIRNNGRKMAVNQLIETDPCFAITDSDNLFRRQAYAARTIVNDDKIVPQPVHFNKRDLRHKSNFPILSKAFNVFSRDPKEVNRTKPSPH